MHSSGGPYGLPQNGPAQWSQYPPPPYPNFGPYPGAPSPFPKKKKVQMKNKICYILFTLSMCAIGLALLVTSIFSPSYHFVVIASMLNTITLDVGLLKVHAEGQCRNSLVNIKLFTAFCEAMTNHLRDISLTQLEVYACQAQTTMFNLIPTGCSSVSAVGSASYLLLTILLFSTTLYIFGTFLFIVFWALKRSKKVRLAALLTTSLCAVFLVVGITLYLYIGGANIHLHIPILMIDLVNFDLAMGFLVCLLAVFWASMTPFILLITMPKVCCEDYEPDDVLDPQTEALLAGMHADFQQQYHH